MAAKRMAWKQMEVSIIAPERGSIQSSVGSIIYSFDHCPSLNCRQFVGFGVGIGWRGRWRKLPPKHGEGVGTGGLGGGAGETGALRCFGLLLFKSSASTINGIRWLGYICAKCTARFTIGNPKDAVWLRLVQYHGRSRQLRHNGWEYPRACAPPYPARGIHTALATSTRWLKKPPGDNLSHYPAKTRRWSGQPVYERTTTIRRRRTAADISSYSTVAEDV